MGQSTINDGWSLTSRDSISCGRVAKVWLLLDARCSQCMHDTGSAGRGHTDPLSTYASSSSERFERLRDSSNILCRSINTGDIEVGNLILQVLYIRV